MKVSIKTEKEIIAMRKSGHILAIILEDLKSMCQSGVKTEALALGAEELLKIHGAKPVFKGYGNPPFPSVICISVNEQVIHGIPGNRRLKNGDIVGLDFGVKIDGMITDSAITVPVGAVQPAAQMLLKTTKLALDSAINIIKPGIRVGDISATIEASSQGLGIVRDFVGHGVGHSLHEPPNIPNYGVKGSGLALKAGMTIAIEPMFTLGSDDVYIDEDDWTVVTSDHSLSAHFEHTILITDDGCEILTI